MALGGASGGNARGIEAGRAFVRLGAKDDLSGQLAKISAKFAQFGKSVIGATGIGGAIGGVLGGLGFKQTTDDITKMKSAIDAMGMSASGGSGLFGVLNQFGDIGENVEGLTQFAQKVQDAFNGVGEEPKKLFDGLSVSAAELIGLPLEEQFLRIHAAIRELPQDMQQFKLSMLGGTDSMKKWLPLLSMSNDEVRAQAKALSMGGSEMQDAADASRAMAQAGGAVNRVWQQFAIAVAPVVTSAAKWMSESLKPLVEWSKGRTLGMMWDEMSARFGLAWEEMKYTVQDAWIEIGAQTKIGLLSIGEFVEALFTKDFWAGLLTSTAAQFSTVGNMFADLLNGMRDQAIKIGAEIAAALTDPRKLAMLPLLPLAAPVAAGDLLKRADEEFKRQMTALGADFAAGKFGRFDRAGILAEAEAAKLAAGGGVSAARGNLAAVLARIDRDRAERVGGDIMGMGVGGRPGAAAMAGAGSSLGTFGSGSFLTQGFGRQSADNPAKQTVKELQKANVTLKDVVTAVKSSVLRFQ